MKTVAGYNYYMRIGDYEYSINSLIIIALILTALISGVFWLFGQHHPLKSSLALTSPSFKNNQNLPAKFSCFGANINPAFQVNGLPKETKSLIIYAEQSPQTKEEAKKLNANLWLVFDIPPTITTISEGIRPPGIITRNWRGNFNYNGPCPSNKKLVTVTFTLLALDIRQLPLNASTSLANLNRIAKKHIIDRATLSARFTRPN